MRTVAVSRVMSFQSTLSMRRATARKGDNGNGKEFQSTLSMRRATNQTSQMANLQVISIHALHEESDFPYTAALGNVYEFQSTLSMRRATCVPVGATTFAVISIHALHEESDGHR